ncbi:MAG TPA: hypothetical protein VFF30_10345 [Nitrososphaerales archaeon]|nr:hypothetical protein [Nitrososphaerales archaeon]
MLDPQKMKKLQELAQTISGQAQAAEKEGSKEEAAKLYIKLVDILLLLARESGDNTKWAQYTRQAEAYQARVKSLIGSNPPAQFATAQQQGPNYEGMQQTRSVSRDAPAPQAAAEQPDSEETDLAASKRIGSLKKLLKPFQKSEATESGPGRTPESSTVSQPPLAAETITQAGVRSTVSSSTQQQQLQITQPPATAQISQEAAAEAALIAEQRYQKVASENKNLRERLESVTKERDELVLLLESRIKEFQTKIASMVPKTEYDSLAQAHLLSQQASKAEIERLEARLGSSVPKAQFDQLLAMVSAMVPRDLYIQAEVRAARLESDLRNALPRNLIDSLATDVSIISALAAIPEPDEIGDKDTQVSSRKKGSNGEPKGAT